MIEPGVLFEKLVKTAPYQPATNLWRAIELDAVQRHGIPRGRVLDLGCGDGKLTAILSEALGDAGHREWVGIDPDPQETSLAAAGGMYSKVVTCMGDSIPEPSETFDAVFSNSVLEHIPGIEPVIAEASRLLVKGGRFVFTVPSDTFHGCLKGPVFGGNRQEYLSGIDARCAHLRYLSLEQWREMLSRHGLTIRASTEYLDARQVRRWELLSNLTAGLLYRMNGRSVQPIEIQRKLRMRSEKVRVIDRLAALACRMSTVGASLSSRSGGDTYGCLLVDAEKR